MLWSELMSGAMLSSSAAEGSGGRLLGCGRGGEALSQEASIK
jgi:hypothetical protein